MTHNHGATSNTIGSFSTFIGCRLKGVLYDALPLGRLDLSRGTNTLVFECGWGLTFAGNGSYWVECPQEIAQAIRIRKGELAAAQRETEAIWELAGVKL